MQHSTSPRPEIDIAPTGKVEPAEPVPIVDPRPYKVFGGRRHYRNCGCLDCRGDANKISLEGSLQFKEVMFSQQDELRFERVGSTLAASNKEVFQKQHRLTEEQLRARSTELAEKLSELKKSCGYRADHSEWSVEPPAWGGAGNEHVPSLEKLADAGQTKRHEGEIEVGKDGRISVHEFPPPEKDSIAPLSQEDEDLERFCQEIEQYCQKLRWKLRACRHCGIPVIAVNPNDQLHSVCRAEREARQKLTSDRKPERRENKNAAGRNKYSQRKRGKVRPYKRSQASIR
jgi:hypothetical protein